jgi:hypothetical protein
MLQVSIVVLFAIGGLTSAVVVCQVLRRAWSAAGELQRALAECETVQSAVVRTYAIERRAAPPVLRVIPGARTYRTAPAPCALRVAA